MPRLDPQNQKFKIILNQYLGNSLGNVLPLLQPKQFHSLLYKQQLHSSSSSLAISYEFVAEMQTIGFKGATRQ